MNIEDFNPWDLLLYGFDQYTEERRLKPVHQMELGGLLDCSASRYHKLLPEAHLLLYLLVDAGRSRDYKFLDSVGETICWATRVNWPSIKKAFQLIWDKEDEKI